MCIIYGQSHGAHCTFFGSRENSSGTRIKCIHVFYV